MIQNTSTSCQLRLKLENTSKQKKLLHLEPWGDEQFFEPGQILEISGRGSSSVDLRVEIAEDSVTIWGWEGSILEVTVVGD